MVKHIRCRDIGLDLHRPDERHIGQMRNLWTHAHDNGNLLFEVGYGEFEGEMRTPPQCGFDMVVIVLDGTGSIDSDGARYDFTQGDALIYAAPVGETNLVSDGFRYAYVTHWQTREHRDTAGWAAAGEPRVADGTPL